ncbi:MAG: hypothetical protein IJS37_06050 [Bacilli bacterium]|nr:hypothetical protein [Bacilli bacterium]
MILFAVPHVRYFGIYYFVAIFGMALLATLSVFLCKKKGPRFAHRFILALVWANFALHFVKQFTLYYFERWPYSLSASGVPNLCAFFVLFGPLMYLSKNKYLRDYFFYIGVLSGILVFFWPTTAVEATYLDGLTYVLECIRFYLCHLLILIAPLCMVASGLHKLEFRRLWAIPLCFGFALFIIALHCVICGPLLRLPGYIGEWFGPNGIFGRQGSNESMQFGPQAKFDKTILGSLYPFWFPYLLSYNIDGVTYFVPVLWMIPALYLGTYIIGPIMLFLADPKGTRIGWLTYKQKRKMRRNARKNKC